MKTTNDTRIAILDVAQDLVQRQSISGVSFQDVAKRIGIKKGSMYYHFETKDDLSIAMVDRVTEQLKESFKRGEHKTARQRLEYFLGIYLQHIDAGSKMCTGGAFAGEWGALTGPVQAAVRRLITTQIKGVRTIIEAGVEAGEFTLDGRSPDNIARWVMSTVQGGLLVSRVMGDAEPFMDSVEVIRSFFGMK